MLPPMLSVSDFIDSVSPLPDYDYVMVDNPDPEWGKKNTILINQL
jgi:hypothetical protein